MIMEYCERCDKETAHIVEEETPVWKQAGWSHDDAPTSELIDYLNGDICETRTCSICGASGRYL